MSTAPDLRFNFAYTYEDFRDASKLLTRASTKSPSRSFLGWILILAVAVLIFVVFHDSKTPAPAPAVPAPAPPANPLADILLNLLPYALIILVVGFLVFGRKINARRTWNKRDKKSPITLTFLPTGLLWETPDSRSENAWTFYERFAESPTVFVLYIAEKQGIPLPKRILSPDQILQVRAILNANIGKPKGFEVLPPKQNP